MKMGILNGELVAIGLFLIGLYGLMARRNIIKSVISLGIIQASIIFFFLHMVYVEDKNPPMLGSKNMVDPFPQALMITAIVIGVAVTAVSLTMFISLYHHYGTTNWQKVRAKRKEEI